jgi:hypothetical protein
MVTRKRLDGTVYVHRCESWPFLLATEQFVLNIKSAAFITRNVNYSYFPSLYIPAGLMRVVAGL